jgi:hypothetical protein
VLAVVAEFDIEEHDVAISGQRKSSQQRSTCQQTAETRAVCFLNAFPEQRFE